MLADATAMNSGDTIRYRGDLYAVACAHPDEGWLYTLGHPARRLHIDACELVQAATAEQANNVTVALAASTAKTHRPECARRRLGASAGIVGDYGI